MFVDKFLGSDQTCFVSIGVYLGGRGDDVDLCFWGIMFVFVSWCLLRGCRRIAYRDVLVGEELLDVFFGDKSWSGDDNMVVFYFDYGGFYPDLADIAVDDHRNFFSKIVIDHLSRGRGWFGGNICTWCCNGHICGT